MTIEQLLDEREALYAERNALYAKIEATTKKAHELEKNLKLKADFDEAAGQLMMAKQSFTEAGFTDKEAIKLLSLLITANVGGK